MEIRTPPVLEDFSPGDRMYLSSATEFRKGTVTSLEAGLIHVTMDNSWTVKIPVSDLDQQDYKGEYWGRMPHIDLIKAGTVLSRFSPDGTRHYATVRSALPGVEVIIEDSHSLSGVRAFKVSEGCDLEKVFRDFEVED